jgi:hypothetical protein
MEKKILPLNPYFRDDYKGQFGPGILSLTHTSCYPPETGTLAYDGLVANPVLTDGYGELSGYLYNVLNEHQVDLNALAISALADCQPDLDMLTTALELPKTIKMVLGIRKTAQELIRAALRGGWAVPKAAASANLQWKYGWKQMVYDMQNVDSFLSEPIRRHVMKGQAGDSFVLSQFIDPSSVSARAYTSTTSSKVSLDSSWRSRVILVSKGRTQNYTANAFITAWELTPYSFVADWIVNVGQVLAALNVILSSSEAHFSYGRKATVEVVTEVVVTPGTDLAIFPNASGSVYGHERYESKMRIPGYVPIFLPSFNVHINTSRFMDAISLLLVRINR